MKKHFFPLLIAALLLSGCGTSDLAEETGPTAETPAVTSETTETSPFDGLSFSDADFTILYIGNDAARALIRADEITGDTMNDAIYSRNLQTKDALRVNISYIEGSDATADCSGKIKTAVMAGEDAYQMGIIHRVDGIADLALNGCLHNYAALPYVKLDEDWWNRTSMEIMSYRNNMYFGYSRLYPISTFCYFFDKSIAAEVTDKSLYDIVRNGDWTIDTMAALCQAAARDLDGDGKMTRADRYGIAMRNATIMSGFYLSTGIHLSENKGDHVELSLYSEKTVDLVDKVYALISDDDVSYMRKDADLTIRSGQILFYLDSLDNANGHRASDVDFGLLPYPKYDAAQTEYVSFANPNLQCVPSMANAEMAGAVIEYMAENSGGVTEAFYEKTLKGKVASDSDSAAMVDLMMANYIVDFAANYCGFSPACTRLYNVFSNLLSQNSNAFTSFYEKYAEQAQAEIDAVFAGLQE